MILDQQNQYSDAQALTATAASTNLIDHGSDRDLGIGEPLAVVLTVDVALAGTTPTFQFALQTDTTSAFGAAVNVVTSQSYTALAQGQRVAIAVPPDTSMARYSRLNYTLGGTTPTITVTAELIPYRFIQAENIFSTGFLVD